MTSETSSGTRILGKLAADDGGGVVRIEDRHDAGVDDVWSALTDPERLSGWYGEVKGDLQSGGVFHADLGHWVGTGRVDACERGERLLVTMREIDATDETVVESTLTPDADGTVLVIQVRGLPVDKLGAYGVGWQIHAENLAAYLAGRGRVDSEARWAELTPAYRELAAAVA